jgi:autotransporter passenger strand-loop-strand repeat protein
VTDIRYNDGQVVHDAVVSANDEQELLSSTQNVDTGAQSYNTTVEAGGTQWVNYGTSHDTLLNGGVETLYIAGASYGTIVNSGGTLLEYGTSASAAYNTVVNNGGEFQDNHGGAHDTDINSGGKMTVNLYGDPNDGAGLVTGTTVHSGGTLQIAGGVVDGTHLDTGGNVIVPLEMGGQTSATFDSSAGVLSITSGSSSYSLGLAGNYDGVRFDVSQAPGLVYAQVTASAVCFCSGTRIMTTEGEVAVEALTVGTEVVTARGAIRPIRWIGTIAGIVNKDARPVIIRRGAFPGGLPIRDLRVTPGHSFQFGDVLIPIGKLVNGQSILVDENARTVELFHLELDVHDLLIAEGALAESYRDDGNRVGLVGTPDGHRAPRTMPTCAPVVLKGPLVERTRRRLSELAVQSPLNHPLYAVVNS